jgi:hypothetical protein
VLTSVNHYCHENALAYFFSAQFYVAANYVPAYALIAVFFASVVFFVYQAGSRLEKSGTPVM